MEMIFHSHANKTHFHKKVCALGLILKMRVFGISDGVHHDVIRHAILDRSQGMSENRGNKTRFARRRAYTVSA